MRSIASGSLERKIWRTDQVFLYSVFRKAVEAISAWGEIRHRLITGEITQEEYDAWKRKF